MANDKTRTDFRRICSFCGKIFQSCNRKRKFCSRQCYYRNRGFSHFKVFEKTCPICGKTFATAKESQVVCSDICKHREDYKLHRREYRALAEMQRISQREIHERDSHSYAIFRKKCREKQRRIYEKRYPGCRPYAPRVSCRIPDWAVKGQEIMDRRSGFISGNMTDEQVMAAKAYARELRPVPVENRPRVKTIFRSR